MQTPLSVRDLALLLLGYKEDDKPTNDEVVSRYRKVAMVLHPDYNKTEGNQYMFLAAQKAKEFLLGEVPVVVISVPAPTQAPEPWKSDFWSEFDSRSGRYTPPPAPEPEREQEENKKKYTYTPPTPPAPSFKKKQNRTFEDDIDW